MRSGTFDPLGANRTYFYNGVVDSLTHTDGGAYVYLLGVKRLGELWN